MLNSTMIKEQDFEELSYREIQAIAKSNGVPANKKREVLIAMIVEKNLEAQARKSSESSKEEMKVNVSKAAKPVEKAAKPQTSNIAVNVDKSTVSMSTMDENHAPQHSNIMLNTCNTPTKKSSGLSFSTPVRYNVENIAHASSKKEKNMEQIKFWLSKGSTPVKSGI